MSRELASAQDPAQPLSALPGGAGDVSLSTGLLRGCSAFHARTLCPTAGAAQRCAAMPGAEGGRQASLADLLRPSAPAAENTPEELPAEGAGQAGRGAARREDRHRPPDSSFSRRARGLAQQRVCPAQPCQGLSVRRSLFSARLTGSLGSCVRFRTALLARQSYTQVPHCVSSRHGHGQPPGLGAVQADRQCRCTGCR